MLNEHTNDDISFVKRSTILSENKQAIAERAARLVSDGDTIMVDASTTCLALISELQRKKNLTIITNSVRLVHDYLQGPFHLISTGGVVRANSCALVGDVALATLQRYNVDLALVSCKSLDRGHGILLADHTKFGSTAFVHALDFDQVDALVTDEPVSTNWRNFLEKKQIELID